MSNYRYSTGGSGSNVSTNSFFAQSMAREEPGGNVMFEVYGISTLAHSTQRNCDNVFMNGIYMNKFTFSHFEKYINTTADRALFILCSGNENSDFSKEFLAEVFKNMDSIKILPPREAMSLVYRIACAFDRSNYSGGGGMGVAILLIDDKKTYTMTCGNVRVVSIKNNIPCILEEGARPPVGVGALNPADVGNMKVKNFQPDTKFVLESVGFSRFIDDEHLSDALERYGVKGGVNQMIDRARGFNFDDTLSVVAIKARQLNASGGKNISTALIIALTALLGVGAIIAIILALTL